jgi:hypothetical protein
MNTRKTSTGRTANPAGATTGTLGATVTSASAKQKQVSPSSELLRSFKATTNLANGLTKERVHIQNEFQKISAGKSTITVILSFFQARSFSKR